MSGERMRAMQYHDYGNQERLRVAQLSSPVPGDGQLLVRVESFAVNPIDWKLMSGKFRFLIRPSFPCTPCFDICGTVLSLGPGAQGFQVGDRVVTREPGLNGGGAAEEALILAEAASHAPADIASEALAALPLAGQTALQALRSGQGLQEGVRVLIIGASGGVGHLAVQLARHAGAHVTGVCSTPNVAFVLERGANAVIDYRTQEGFHTDGPYDLVIDCVGKSSWKTIRDVLSPNGRVEFLAPSPSHLPILLTLPLCSQRQARFFNLQPNSADMRFLVDRMVAGDLVVDIDTIYEGLEKLPEAFARSMTGRARGKLVVRVPPQD